jgi:hypothetical protein
LRRTNRSLSTSLTASSTLRRSSSLGIADSEVVAHYKRKSRGKSPNSNYPLELRGRGLGPSDSGFSSSSLTLGTTPRSVEGLYWLNGALPIYDNTERCTSHLRQQQLLDADLEVTAFVVGDVGQISPETQRSLHSWLAMWVRFRQRPRGHCIRGWRCGSDRARTKRKGDRCGRPFEDL